MVITKLFLKPKRTHQISKFEIVQENKMTTKGKDLNEEKEVCLRNKSAKIPRKNI